MWTDYLHTQFDPAHLLSETGFELAQLALLWLFGRRWLNRLHHRFDDTHHLTHEEEGKGMADLMPHTITVDESTDEFGGAMFKAFCEDCDWSGPRWHHADEYSDRDGRHPADIAYDAAERDGATHKEET